MIAILATAVLVLTIGAVSAFAFTPTAPYFFTTTSFAYPDVPPMGNSTIFDIEDDNDGNTLVFFQPERYYEDHIRHNLVGVVDEFYVVNPSTGQATNTIISNEGYAEINQSWRITDGATGVQYYVIEQIGVNIYDTDAHAFSRHMEIQTVYLKVN
jgi:hypothetical protein